MTSLSLLDILMRLVAAAGLTAIIGVDRELRGKAAGLRTNIVVGTATAAFTLIGAELLSDGLADPGRVAAQVVSGIGFLGGGAIFAAGGRPHGLTTAAALWGSAAIGLAAGVAAYDVAVALVVVLMVVLWPLDRLAAGPLQARGRQETRAQLILRDLGGFLQVRALLGEYDVRITDMRLSELANHLALDLRIAGRRDHVLDVLGALDRTEGVEAVASESVTQLRD